MKLLRYGYVALFLLICLLTLLFLHTFTKDAGTSTVMLDWEQMHQVGTDGSLQPVPANEMMPAEDTQYVFSTVLAEVPQNGYLMFETSGSEIRLWLDDVELYYASAAQPAETVNISQAHVVLPKDAAGKTITMEYRFLGGDNFIFPPLLQLGDPITDTRTDTAYANYYGIPAGAFGLLFILICGLFLLGLSFGKTDYTLLVLALAAAGLMIYPISFAFGNIFLPASLQQMFTWPGLEFLTPIALILYLLLNRRRSFWKYLGYVTLCSAAVLLAAYFISLAQDGFLSRYLNGEITSLFLNGIYSGLLYWLTVYLTMACSLIAGSGVVYSFAKMQSETQMLRLKNSLMDENFRAVERSARQTAAMRHELKHNITMLHLMYQQGDMDGLGHALGDLDKQQSGLTQIQFTDHFIINTLLQNAAADAAEQGIRFDAYAMVPAALQIDERDLCGFIMNLLDNAIEACQKVSDPARRFIQFHAELKQGFLAISCSNSCEGNPIKENQKLPQSTKPDQSVHGFGLRQMNAIAKKYHSVLNIECDGHTFTVQTALKTRQ